MTYLVSKFHTYSDVSKLGKVDLKRLASQLNCFSPGNSMETAWLPYLQKLRNWGKSISALPRNINIQDVKRFLIGSGFKEEEVKKYKTLLSWEHKQGVHSLRYTCLLMGLCYYCKL